MATLKENSRIDTSKGFLITKKPYKIEAFKSVKHGFYLVKIKGKVFKTDYSNIIFS